MLLRLVVERKSLSFFTKLFLQGGCVERAKPGRKEE
jgi:hypothetical protein